MSTDDDVKADIARQEAALLQLLTTGVAVEVPDVRRCILARSYGDRVRKMFPQEWDTSKTGMDMDLFFPEAIEQAAESALDRFYDMEPGAFPYHDCRFEPHRPMHKQLWRIVRTTTSLQTKATLLRPYSYVYGDDHDQVAQFICEELARTKTDQARPEIAAYRLQLPAAALGIVVADDTLRVQLAHACYELVFPLRKNEFVGDQARNAHYAVRIYGDSLEEKDLGLLEVFLEPGVGDQLKYAALEVIQVQLSSCPPAPALRWGSLARRITTITQALTNADVLVNNTMRSLCRHAYVVTILLTLDQDLSLTKRLLACQDPSTESVLKSLETTLTHWDNHPKAEPEQLKQLKKICTVLKDGFTSLKVRHEFGLAPKTAI